MATTHPQSTHRDTPKTDPNAVANKGGLQNDANPEARNPNPTLTEGGLPKEGLEPGPGTVPHPGGAFAKTGGGAFSGGCVPEPADPPPEEDAHASKTAKK